MKLQIVKYGTLDRYSGPLRFSTILFVCVILVSIATLPSVSSQTFTTLTSIFATTGVFTSTSYATAVVGSTTLTATTNSAMISTTYTLAVYGKDYCNWENELNITVSVGTTQITGTIGPSSASESFYILTQQQYNDFVRAQQAGCNGYEGGEVDAGSLASAYTLDWANPPPGFYYVVFYEDSGTFPITTPFFLIATSAQAQTSMIFSVGATQVSAPTTETLTSLQVSQIPTSSSPTSSAPTSISGFPWAPLLIVCLVGIAIVLIISTRKRRQKSS